MTDNKPQMQEADRSQTKVNVKQKQKQKKHLTVGISYSNCR